MSILSNEQPQILVRLYNLTFPLLYFFKEPEENLFLGIYCPFPFGDDFPLLVALTSLPLHGSRPCLGTFLVQEGPEEAAVRIPGWFWHPLQLLQRSCGVFLYSLLFRSGFENVHLVSHCGALLFLRSTPSFSRFLEDNRRDVYKLPSHFGCSPSQ